MGQRLGNLDKWEPLAGDGKSGVSFPGGPRPVTLEVNAPERTALYVEYEVPKLDADGNVRGFDLKEQFLALVEGRDKVEFTVGGDFTLFADKDCLYYTGDDQETHNVVIAPVIFTRIANRKERNPNMEMMEFKMRLNIERRMQALEREAMLRRKDEVNRYAPRRSTVTPPELVSDEPADGEAQPAELSAAAPAEAGAGKASGGKGGGKPKPAVTAADD